MNHSSALNMFARLILVATACFLASCSKRTRPEAAAPKAGQIEHASQSEHDDHKHNDHEHGEHDHDDHGKTTEAHADEVTLTAEAVERYGVHIETAQVRILQPTVVMPARVGFNTEAMAHVGSPLRGRAVEVKVRLGDSVKAGQELVIVESPELGEAQADLLQKQTAVVTAGPAVELSKIAWERAKGLYERSQGISLTEVQRREAEYKAAIAGGKAAEAAATAAENRLHLLGMDQQSIAALGKTGEIVPRYAIRSAIDGVVVQREVTLGELVNPDRESLMVIADTRNLWVLADVPEAKLAGIARGSKAWITIGTVTSAAEGTTPASRLEGTVAFVSPIVDPMTRTAQVRVEVPASVEGGQTGEQILRPGMFAEAEIVQSASGEETTPVVAVPDEAIQTVEGGPAVFVPVADEPNTFAKRAVTVGKPVGGMVPILTGLADGEPFVVRGTFILKAELGKAGAAHEH